MEFQVSLKYARVGAQKARLVADMVRGWPVSSALKVLKFSDKKTAVMIKKLLESAVANAESTAKVEVDSLIVKRIYVDQGPSLKRFRPRAQGRAFGVLKKTSHINLILGER